MISSRSKIKYLRMRQQNQFSSTLNLLLENCSQGEAHRPWCACGGWDALCRQFCPFPRYAGLKFRSPGLHSKSHLSIMGMYNNTALNWFHIVKHCTCLSHPTRLIPCPQAHSKLDKLATWITSGEMTPPHCLLCRRNGKKDNKFSMKNN